ncbi:MAG: DinB family protein [Gemmatimonadaceae bacterium]
MSLAQMFLPEFDQEMATTRKFLERTPDALAGWKPHDKSMSLGRLAQHLAEIPSWGLQLTESELDIAPPGGPKYEPTPYTSSTSALAEFDKNVAASRAVIAGTSDEEFMKPWTFKMGGQTLFTIPKSAMLRTWVLSHIIHHRAQFGVFLRLNNVAIPGSYGPSADEMGM